MPKFQEHFETSWLRVRENHHDLVVENREVICRLLVELHEWFDFFCGKEGYDSAYTVFFHREQRHHRDGILDAIEIFSAKYGEKFREIIRQEAERHVLDDFGEIPAKDEVTRRYLREKRGW